MSAADELLAAGDLDGARAALVDRVRAAPDDAQARMFLFQLMAVCGEWDKAATQLRALAQLSPDTQMLAVVYGQALEAEKTRAQAFAGGAPIPILVPSAPWADQLAEGLALTFSGDTAAGETARNAAFDAAGETPGSWNGDAFGWIADADSLFGPTFEAVIAGRWGLIPFEAVVSMHSEGPQDLRDLVWLPAELALRSGQSAAVLLPARYAGSEGQTSAAVRLGRATEWTASAGGERGLGQKLLVSDTDGEFGLLSLRDLRMD
jgi:type VI secretion system protein ImpE